MKKIFKNRITQEDETILHNLKSTYINENKDKARTPDTPTGLFFISLQPNQNVDEVKLERDFNFILCLYYRWRYGSKWTSLKHLQQMFSGIIEKQEGFFHIHFILYNENVEEVAMFCGYIKAQFKQMYPRSSFDAQFVFDIKGNQNYISVNNMNKKRTSCPIVINNMMYQ